ncbi:MAG: hypothetical protein ACE5PO_09390, partial [Candidatus Bathyarchaeia archaeon]
MSAEKKEEKKIPRRTFISGVAGAAVAAGVGGFVGGMFSAPAGAERVIERTVEVPVEVPVAPGAPAAPLYEPSAEARAVNAVRKYLADNNLDPKDVALTIMTPAGATSNWDWSWPIWEQLTGIPISNFEVPYGESVPKVLPEAAAQTGRWDITCSTPGEPIGDFTEAGLTVTLDDFMQKYDPQYTTAGFGPEAPWPAGPGFEHVTSASRDNCPVHIVDFATGVYRGKMQSWVTDGDVWNL